MKIKHDVQHLVRGLAKCPRCGTEVARPSKEWDYSVFHVKKFDCKKCEKGFMAYFNGGRLSHARLVSKTNGRTLFEHKP